MNNSQADHIPVVDRILYWGKFWLGRNDMWKSCQRKSFRLVRFGFAMGKNGGATLAFLAVLVLTGFGVTPLGFAAVVGVGVIVGLRQGFLDSLENGFNEYRFELGFYSAFLGGVFLNVAATYLGPPIIAALGIASLFSPASLALAIVLLPVAVATLGLIAEPFRPGAMKAIFDKIHTISYITIPEFIGGLAGGLVGGALGLLATPFYDAYSWRKERRRGIRQISYQLERGSELELDNGHNNSMIYDAVGNKVEPFAGEGRVLGGDIEERDRPESSGSHPSSLVKEQENRDAGGDEPPRRVLYDTTDYNCHSGTNWRVTWRGFTP